MATMNRQSKESEVSPAYNPEDRMPKRAAKGQETRPVSFRMPLDVYDDLAGVAEARGVDLSAILNWICAEYRPVLLLKQAVQQAGMLHAKVTDLREPTNQRIGAGEAL